MTAPATAYGARAGVNVRPLGFTDVWTDAHLGHEEYLGFVEASLRSVWADWSEFQPVVNSRYPYPFGVWRADTGYRLDNHATLNRAAWASIPHAEGHGMYGVFIPGESRAIQKRLVNAFGSQVDCAWITDMESGQGFAGPGDHSNEATDFALWASEWTSGRPSSLGYANSPDWAANWRTRPSWMHRIVASYGSTLETGYFAQQYFGGLNYPVPAGLPRACEPFGSWVDLNTAALSNDALHDSLGLDWLSMTTRAEVQTLIDARADQTDALIAELIAAVGAIPGRVWRADVIPAPSPADPKNPTWTPSSFLHYILEGVQAIRKGNAP